MGIFLAGIRKKLLYCSFFTSEPYKLFRTKFCPKTKILKFGTKLFQLDILSWNFKKLMSNLKSASPNLLTWKVSPKNKKHLNLGTQIPYLGILPLQFNKNYYEIFNQHSRICETIKFYPKRKKNKFWTKTFLFGSLAEMLKNYCHISNPRF